VQLNVLLQLADHWWEAERLPFPSKVTIAARMGVTPRHVQRYLTALAEAGLIRRIARYGTQGGQLNNAYDLGGLVEKLKKLEPAFKKEQEEAKARKRDLEKPGGGRRIAAAAASE
jgi:DeoR/GlpR family transcriptional regulator of sugar metabolism